MGHTSSKAPLTAVGTIWCQDVVLAASTLYWTWLQMHLLYTFISAVLTWRPYWKHWIEILVKQFIFDFEWYRNIIATRIAGSCCYITDVAAILVIVATILLIKITRSSWAVFRHVWFACSLSDCLALDTSPRYLRNQFRAPSDKELVLPAWIILTFYNPVGEWRIGEKRVQI